MFHVGSLSIHMARVSEAIYCAVVIILNALQMSARPVVRFNVDFLSFLFPLLSQG